MCDNVVDGSSALVAVKIVDLGNQCCQIWVINNKKLRKENITHPTLNNQFEFFVSLLYHALLSIFFICSFQSLKPFRI